MNNLPIQTYESVVQQRDALEKKLADMAAENYALKVSQSEIYDYTQQFTSSDDREMWNAMHDIYKLSSPLETPATDAFTREWMAKGVDALAAKYTNMIETMHPDTIAYGALKQEFESVIKEANKFAAQLRKGINDAQ
ncbi:hypothetical protein MVR12_005363 [Escherichia coli]|uniref:hypothetical protein n=1 Tax=Hafnia paralvei TaxID=546367 RepID=UPI001F46803E|nr:hypothetical protein [Hafnia paralvei]EAQ6918496.1 hypothetical protein [Salmonella enterica]EJA4670356.1 hypothetical protein [Escherichia coli]MCE9949403.1 hypothetical protein [Hafnia paralvei]